MIYTEVPSNTIYFIVPSNTLNSNPTSYIAIDRNPSEAHSIRMIEYTQETTPLKQARADGINTKEIEVNFTVKGEVEELNLIVAFFRLKKGVLDFTLYNPLSSNIKLVVDQWAVGLQNYNFGIVQAKGRLCY